MKRPSVESALRGGSSTVGFKLVSVSQTNLPHSASLMRKSWGEECCFEDMEEQWHLNQANELKCLLKERERAGWSRNVFSTIILYRHLRVCHAFWKAKLFETSWLPFSRKCLCSSRMCRSRVSWHVVQPAFWFNEVTWLPVLQEQL